MVISDYPGTEGVTESFLSIYVTHFIIWLSVLCENGRWIIKRTKVKNVKQRYWNIVNVIYNPWMFYCKYLSVW